MLSYAVTNAVLNKSESDQQRLSDPIKYNHPSWLLNKLKELPIQRAGKANRFEKICLGHQCGSG